MKVHHLHLRKRHQGVTLIEMMIAMVLSLILLAGVVVIMRGSKTSYDTQNDVTRIQENARYALDFLAKDLRMAGYFGCSGKPDNSIPAIEPALIGRNDIKVGSNGPSSDIIRMVYMDSSQQAFAIMHCPPFTAYQQFLRGRYASLGAYQQQDCPPPTNPIAFRAVVDATPLRSGAGSSGSPFNLTNIQPPGYIVNGDIKQGDIMVASDCRGSDLYTVNSTAGNALSLIGVGTPIASNGLSRFYNNPSAGKGQSYGAELRPVRIQRYFVGEVQRNGNNYYALCRDSNTIGTTAPVCNEENEILEGVENLQVLYGVWDTNNNLQYLNASQVAASNQWASIASVKITLLMQSTDERHNRDVDTKTYKLDPLPPNKEYGPLNDHRIRRVFSTVVMLRNWRLN